METEASDSSLIEIQPREVGEYSYRGLYAVGADPEEARIGANAVLLAEVQSGSGLELLRSLLAEDWSEGGLPSVRRALQEHEWRSAEPPAEGDVPAEVRAAVEQENSGTLRRAYSGALQLHPQRFRALKECGAPYLVTLKEA